MNTLREAATKALEALEDINKLSVGPNAICLPAEIDTAMDALRAALAEPTYPLPDDLYPGSKDWVHGGYAERVQWLHMMYEATKEQLVQHEAAMWSKT